MMMSWESAENKERPLPEICIDCGPEFGMVVRGVKGTFERPEVDNPEPALIKGEEERRLAYERGLENRQRQQQEYERSQHEHQMRSEENERKQQQKEFVFVDVDEVEVEEVKVDFTAVDMPPPPKKKRKKKL